MPEAGSDAELLDRAVRGDPAALRDLLKLHGPTARAVISRKIDRRWRALLDDDDVMQVAYLEAFLHIDQLASRDTRSFVSWLTRIAENALRDALRGLTRDKRPNPTRRIYGTPNGGGGHSGSHAALLDILGATTTTPSRHATTNEAAASIESALERLPPDYREVVRLYDLQGLSPTQVASRLGRSIGAVHMLRARAHDRLREELGGVGGGARFFSGQA